MTFIYSGIFVIGNKFLNLDIEGFYLKPFDILSFPDAYLFKLINGQLMHLPLSLFLITQ